MKKRVSKGFTLIEMLVVIAIIAVLVAIVIPVVSNTTTKAKAAADAANLRNMMGAANVKLLDEPVDVAATLTGVPSIKCATFPGAKPYIYYVDPGFIIGYYDNDGDIYTIDSFAEAAESGNAPIAVNLPTGGTAYPVGGST